MMKHSLAHIVLIVRDYDEAIAWFTQRLDFAIVEDTRLDQAKRWVLVAPPGAGENAATLLLARAATPEQEAFIGNQAGGRVFLFPSDPLDGSRPQRHTDDFDRDYAAMRAKGVAFVRETELAPYGKVTVFLDLYGNRWDWVEPAKGR